MIGHPCIHSSKPLFVSVAVASSGDNSVVTGVTGKKVRVLGGHLTMVGTAVTIQFKSDTGGGATALTGAMAVAQNGSIPLPFNPFGHFETAKAKDLNISLSGAQSVTGFLVYQLVDG